MRKLLVRRLFLALTFCMLVQTPARTQEYFRHLGTPFAASAAGPMTPAEYGFLDYSPSGLHSLNPATEAEAEDRYNFALGPVRFSVAAGIGIEFNDNITLSDENREEDVIIRPVLDLEAAWRVSELNTLRLSLGVSYAKYINNSEYDTEGLLLSPTSELSYTFGLGPVFFTIRDRFSYQEDPYDFAVLSNVARYRRFENQIGIMAEWQANSSLTITGGYDHYNLWASDEIFSDQDRSIDTVFFKPTYAISPTVRVGLFTSYSYIGFDSGERGNGHSFLVGPSLEWQLSAFTNLYLEAGLQQISYEGGAYRSDYVEALADELDLDEDEVDDLFETGDSDSTSYYVRFEINNRPSDVFQHRLAGSKTAEVGFLSNHYDLYHIEYSAVYEGIRDTQIVPRLFYDYYETSGDIGEEAHRWGASIGVRYNVNNAMTVGLDYRFMMKESNIEAADYRQNVVFISAYYKF